MNNSSTPSSQSLTLEEVLAKPRVAMVTTIMLLLTVFILVGNFLVLWTIYSTRRLRFSAFYFVASLAVSDFLVGVLVLPLSLAYHLTYEMRGQWIFGPVTCKAWLLANFWFCSASVLNLCLVSWDRYVAVMSSLIYKLCMTDSRVLRKIALAWGISFCIALILIIGLQPQTGKNPNCNVLSSHTVLTALGVVFLFIAPVILLVFVNGRIWIVARNHTKRIHDHFQKSDGSNITAAKRQSMEISEISIKTATNSKERKGLSLSRTLMQEIKTFKTFLVVIGVFVGCWTPFFTMLTMSIFRPVQALIFYITIILSYCNSASNVLIYAIFSRDFRKALLKSLKKCSKRLH